ncbi:MAG: YfiR/HmsC family protein [bacterium]
MRHDAPASAQWAISIAAIVLLLMLTASPAAAQVGKGSASFTASNLVKIISMEKHLSGAGKEVSVYVMNDPELTAELQKMVGQSIGQATLKVVAGGTKLPDNHVDVIYIGNPDDYLFNAALMQSFLQYTKDNKILSVTHEAMLIYKGVALGIGSMDGTPKFYINLRTSADTGLDWNKAVIKLAETI